MDFRLILACHTPPMDGGELSTLRMPSYGIRRVQAAAGALPGVEASVTELDERDPQAQAEAILAGDPDLVGFSVYVWSMRRLGEVAQHIKRMQPNVPVIFGGPSARRSAFDLPGRPPAVAIADAIVEGDGEAVIQDIILALRAGHALETVGGLAIPRLEGGWRQTGHGRAVILDELPSPYLQGLMARGDVAYLETFRGCPLSCRFCEWGVARHARDVFSEASLLSELSAIAAHDPAGLFLLDAGLNLNGRAFRNLQAAAQATGALREANFWAEIYPSTVREAHLEFLAGVGVSYLGVGLQSRDPQVLRAHDRHLPGERFEAAVRELSQVAELEIQIIMGLPGDTPEGFLRTFEYAMGLPADVRVYHCLVLPDALLDRGRSEWAMRFDPATLAMISNSTWSETDLLRLRERLSGMARRRHGAAGEFWWSFPK